MSRSPRLAVAGLVATALVAVAACGSSTSSGGVAGATGTPATSAAPSMAASASAAASAAPSGSGALNQKFVTFKAANGSNITGGGILTDLGNNQTAVTIGVVAAGVTDPMPASLTPGDCATAASGSPAPSAGASAGASASAAASAAPSLAASPAGSAGASGSPEASASAIPLTPGSVIKLGDLSAGSSNTVINIGLTDLTSQPYALVIYKSAADMSIVSCGDLM
jgi:hypothetical protein